MTGQDLDPRQLGMSPCRVQREVGPLRGCKWSPWRAEARERWGRTQPSLRPLDRLWVVAVQASRWGVGGKQVQGLPQTTRVAPPAPQGPSKLSHPGQLGDQAPPTHPYHRRSQILEAGSCHMTRGICPHWPHLVTWPKLTAWDAGRCSRSPWKPSCHGRDDWPPTMAQTPAAPAHLQPLLALLLHSMLPHLHAYPWAQRVRAKGRPRAQLPSHLRPSWGPVWKLQH